MLRSTLLAVLIVVAAAPVAHGASSAQRDSAVRWAIKQTGHSENGTTNRSRKIDRWMRGMGLTVPPARPWCGALVHAAFRQAGVRLSSRLIDPDRSYADAKAGRRGLRAIPVSEVRRGDLLFFSFRPGPRASHLAIARGEPRGGRIQTIEGNVSHRVSREKRGVRYVVLAARVTAS